MCVALALGVATLVASSIATAATPKTLTIGVLDSLTGLSSTACAEELNGMNLAVAEASHLRETVNGKKVPYLRGVGIKLNAQDDQSLASAGVTGFRALSDSNAVAIVGPCNGNTAVAVLPTIDTVKIPIIYSTAGDTTIIAPKYAFRGGMPMGYFSGRVIQVINGMGIKNVYAIYSNDIPVYGDMFNAMKATMKVLGMNLVGSFAVGASTVDYGAPIQQIKQANPDAVAVLARSSAVPAVLTQLRSNGVTQQVFGSGNFPSVQRAGPMMKGAIYSTNFADVFPFKSSVRFTNQFKAKYGKGPNSQDANGYDGMWRVLRAIHDAGPAKVAAASTADARNLLQAALSAQKTALGAQGPITYTSLGDSKGPAGVVQIIDDAGNLKLLKVPTVASLLKKK
jgi:branched-chain amino acid transport system substrate-binding protein